ncbi:MAG: hypothetical protein AB1714_03715 [Acidobacteriota bacterium]
MQEKAIKSQLLALLCVSLLFLAGCNSAVLHDVSETEANRVIAVLQEQGVVATKEIENAENNTWRVVVPRRDTVKVWGVLQEYRLPTSPGRRFQDVFGKSKLVVAPIEEKALYLEALQGELSHTLEAVTGVIAARVHVVLPEEDITGQIRGEAKASVMIEYRPDSAGQTPIRQDEVQKIVGNGVSGLKPESVSVVMKPIQMAPSQGFQDFVAFGPLMVARTSMITLKIITAIFVLLLLLMGGLLFWQGRVLSQIRYEHAMAQRQLQSVQRQPRA